MWCVGRPISPLAHRRSSVELLLRCKVHRLHLLRGQGPRASGNSSLSVAALCPVDGRATATARPWHVRSRGVSDLADSPNVPKSPFFIYSLIWADVWASAYISFFLTCFLLQKFSCDCRVGVSMRVRWCVSTSVVFLLDYTV